MLLRLLCLAALACFAASAPCAQDCGGTSVGRVPLHDLGDDTYQGFVGGLYPGGALVRPPAHDASGLAQSTQVVPRNALGAPDPSGSVVLLSVGLSNTTQEFRRFMELVADDPTLHPRLVIVDGAQGGQAAEDVDDPAAPYWSFVDQRLAAAGVSAQQVQAIWLKTANRAPTASFPGWAQTFQGQLATIARIVRSRYPNARLAYVSSRIYAGYATTQLNPEPWAYESGFAVKWLVEQQIAGDPTLAFDPPGGPPQAPWLSWGPYLWGDGLVARSDGRTWQCSDFANDGTHPGNAARDQVAELLDHFFRTDATAKAWYLAHPGPACAPQGRTQWLGAGDGIQLVASVAPTVPTAEALRVLAHGAQPLVPGYFVIARLGAGGQAPGLELRGGVRLAATVTNEHGQAHVDLGAVPPDPVLCGRELQLRFVARDGSPPDGVSRSRFLRIRLGH